MWTEAFTYNAFGPLFLGLCILIVLVSLMPRRWDASLRVLVHRRRRIISMITVMFIGGFVLHGLVRGLLQLMGDGT